MPVGYDWSVQRDLLEELDVEESRRLPPGEKLAQALELMAVGLQLKRASLRKAKESASERELDEAMTRWLLVDG
jgi:hypothetical protein